MKHNVAEVFSMRSYRVPTTWISKSGPLELP